MIVIRKNGKENGKREEDFWSNPHSKGENFSRSNKDFFDKIRHSIIIILAISVVKIKINIMLKINYYYNYL